MNRIITLKNTECLLPLINSWKNESDKTFNIDMDEHLYINHLSKMINGNNSTILGLMKNDKLVGYIGIVLFDNPIGKGLMASEHFWYTLPKNRGIGAIRLLEAAIEWSKSKGCTHFIGNASRLASDLHDKVCAIYKKYGMSHYETSFICEV